ncbi:MAG: DUF1553 domain-containing protein [Bryobacteraceae bacterium]
MIIRTLSLLTLAPLLCPAQSPVSFEKEIQPILQNNCLKCHGAKIQLAKLDLRTKEGATRVLGSKADQSRLYKLVSGQEKPSMPMDGKLSTAEIATIKRWIDEGAPWGEIKDSPNTDTQTAALEDMKLPPEARQYWAFQKPVRRTPPTSTGNPIDAFLKDAMQKAGVTAAPRADKATLVRRAYLDLVGLPPTPAQSAEFVADNSADAWPKLIDRLLASPQYGERWGRHWMDVARYADSNGYEHDFTRPNAWRFRDYVIDAFNKDTPYDVFLKQQLAGDELDHVTNETLIATGFLRQHAKVGYREKDNPENRYEYLDDMIATVGRGILGLTVQCARCHNHKFDPIAQKDYYRLQASLWTAVEVDHPLASPAEAAAYNKKLAEVNARLAELRDKLKAIDQPYKERLLPEKYKKYPENIQQAIATPEAQRTAGQVLLANQVIRTVTVSQEEIERIASPEDIAKKKALTAEMKDTEKQKPAPIPMAMGITDGDYRFTPDGPGDEPAPGKGKQRAAIEGSYLPVGRYQPPPSYFLFRGDPENRGSLMKPGFVAVATYGNPPTELPPANGHTSGRRLALAEWLTSPDNPLTARVMVNRIWQHHFGRGIVTTLDNFGKMGTKPSNPELLDWLATEFVAQGWSFKKMHRLMMTSDAYQQSSQFHDAANVAKDPENRLLWRFQIQRLDAEIVRDSILAVSGALNPAMGGPPVFPKLSQDVLETMSRGIWEREEEGPKVWRRSVYVYRKRGLPLPFFEVFDLPDQNLTCGARNVSTVPTQALTLMNDEFVLLQAKLFAGRVSEAAPGDAAKQINLAYRLALGREPSAEELQIGRDFMAKQKLVDLTHVLLNLNEFLYMR